VPEKIAFSGITLGWLEACESMNFGGPASEDPNE
jgi:hypothetical protein